MWVQALTHWTHLLYFKRSQEVWEKCLPVEEVPTKDSISQLPVFMRNKWVGLSQSKFLKKSIFVSKNPKECPDKHYAWPFCFSEWQSEERRRGWWSYIPNETFILTSTVCTEVYDLESNEKVIERGCSMQGYMLFVMTMTMLGSLLPPRTVSDALVE